jgi:hypothetical protein
LFRGDEDGYGGPEIGERVATLLSESRLDVVEGGHTPFRTSRSAAPS